MSPRWAQISVQAAPPPFPSVWRGGLHPFNGMEFPCTQHTGTADIEGNSNLVHGYKPTTIMPNKQTCNHPSGNTEPGFPPPSLSELNPEFLWRHFLAQHYLYYSFKCCFHLPHDLGWTQGCCFHWDETKEEELCVFIAARKTKEIKAHEGLGSFNAGTGVSWLWQAKGCQKNDTGDRCWVELCHNFIDYRKE